MFLHEEGTTNNLTYLLNSESSIFINLV